MIIDGHSHVTFPVEAHIKAMDDAGVSRTVLFSTTLHPETAENAADVKMAMAYLNDLLAGKKGSLIAARKKAISELVEAIKRYPTRYSGFGSVPPGLALDETGDYIEQTIVRNRLAGIGEFTLGSGQIHLLENIFKASREFGNLAIWIHAFFPLTMLDIREIALLAKRHPCVAVILGHLGGVNWLETMDLVKEASNLYLDTSAFFSTFVLGIVINELPHKCIFGVDRPYGDIQLSLDAVLKVANSKSIANAVLGATMAELLGQ
jgi:predicted TIM-barrel fold metal-dependent hydrolase